MNDSGPFQLRWRGKTSGPFSLADILKQLDDHEIGLWHELGHGAEWTTLGEFLAQQEPDPKAIDARNRPGESARKQPSDQSVRLESSARAGEPSRTPFEAQGVIPVPPPVRNLHTKRRMLFVALGALFGFTGLHNFYAGYWGTALVQIILTSVTMFLGFGFIVSWVWALVELLVVHTDAKGRRMR